MIAPRCARCNDPFELRRPDDRYCVACEGAVTAQIEADEKRRTRRVFATPKDLSGLVGNVL